MMRELTRLHTVSQVKVALGQLPKDMNEFCTRIFSSLFSNNFDSSKAIVKEILSWNLTVLRPLDLYAVQHAIEPSIRYIPAMREIINQLCSSVLALDDKDFVLSIHMAFRDWILANPASD